MNITRVRDENEGVDFADLFKTAVHKTNEYQNEAASMIKKIASGEDVALHDVMIASEKANLSLQLITEVRNKVLEAYKEVMRIQL